MSCYGAAILLALLISKVSTLAITFWERSEEGIGFTYELVLCGLRMPADKVFKFWVVDGFVVVINGWCTGKDVVECLRSKPLIKGFVEPSADELCSSELSMLGAQGARGVRHKAAGELRSIQPSSSDLVPAVRPLNARGNRAAAWNQAKRAGQG